MTGAEGGNREAREDLALRVVELARADVLSAAVFLAPAIGCLPLETRRLDAPLATDGRMLAIDPERVLSGFSAAGKPPSHDMLHTVLHCVLLHPFADAGPERDSWWLACDIAVERLSAQLLGLRDGTRGARMEEVLRAVDARCGDASDARRVLRLLREEDEDTCRAWAELFHGDDHALWGASGASDADGAQQDGDPAADSDADAQAARDGLASGASVGRETDSDEDPRETWVRISRELKASLEALPREYGTRAGMLVQAVRAAVREKVDYARWLRRFAVPGEVLRLSDDGFDQVFYTYGLRRYGDLPLVEPLEQREERRIREFVVVIDTSQSVSGEAVRRFVDETFSILKEGESFFERVHVRIIQCDAQVQADDVITDAADLQRWADSLELRGFGGTDFRPAFRYVDELVEQGAFENLGGLVYFTDGWGIYPEWRPRYQVAFAFYDEDHRAEDVPPWAVQVVLDPDDAGA